MGGIFISYRRQDVPGYAGRTRDSLAAVFGEEAIFMDVVGLEPGGRFRELIDAALDSCDALLAIIGPTWTTVANRAGRPRLFDADDYVRYELRRGLARPDVKVVPILVGGGEMPARHQLPDDLADLCERQAIELTEERWRYDTGRLIDGLGGRREPVDPDRPAAIPLLSVALGLLVAAGPAYAAYNAGLDVKRGTDVQTVAHFAAGWTAFWAVLSAVVSAVVAATGPDRRRIVQRTMRGLLLGALAGGLGGLVNGLLRVHGDNLRLGIVLGFAVTGAVFGLARIAGRSPGLGLAAGAVAGALGGLLVAGNIDGFMSQALPAALILMGIALLQTLAAGADQRSAPVLPTFRRLQGH